MRVGKCQHIGKKAECTVGLKNTFIISVILPSVRYGSETRKWSEAEQSKVARVSLD